MNAPRRLRRRGEPSQARLALRGLAAAAVAMAVAAVLVARASGHLERSADVFVGVPVSAGLITGGSPVRYHGVNVGRIAEIESGTHTSRVRLAIEPDSLGVIPSSAVARIVPRTFFGDIYLQLVDAQGNRSTTGLKPGDTVAIDDSPDAMALYDVFTKIVELFSQIKPERMQTALTAISQSLRNRGEQLGTTIDNLSASAAVLTPTLVRFLDTTPQFRDVMASLNTATPDILSTLSAATSVSDRMVADQTKFASALDGFARFSSVLTSFLSDHREQLITVVDSAGKIMATTAAQPLGLVDTLAGAQSFGEAGAKVFATGKFNITAVATFAGPMPYSLQDCPVYGATQGARCAESAPSGVVPPQPADVLAWPAADLPVTPFTPPAPHLPTHSSLPPGPGLPQSAPVPTEPLPAEAVPTEPAPPVVAPASAVVDADGQAHALAVLQDELVPPAGGPSTQPNIATVLMLGPLVRGTEVQVS
ncbi:MCE family protein [Mycolicibacterium sp. HK-90]|uniref:MCE family protein n=1 Tax=Mycolicibacterium sp. HK-90 TaxID=3056937 RepID=UPI00265B1535|nr:MCE family protein [Mycolicibacterium sp. HK-90]WKG04550.1 MCE family protein [Mycolicibacterium sp. HK-90]